MTVPEKRERDKQEADSGEVLCTEQVPVRKTEKTAGHVAVFSV